MSYPYPQDRHRDRKEEGGQQYKDAREAMAQQEAEIQAEAESFGEARNTPLEEAESSSLEDRAEGWLREVGEERDEAEAKKD